VFQKTLGLNDFYFGGPGVDYPLGNIQMVGKSVAAMYRGEKPVETKLAPDWTLDRIARHAIDFWLSTEDLPRAENRVTLRGDGTLRLQYTPTNEVPKQQLFEQLKSIVGRLGMHHHHLMPRHAYLFPSIGAVNPAVSAMANALRVGDRILERLGVATSREAVA
jgi:hypothetical protein